MGGPSFDSDPLLRDLSRGMSLSAALSPRRIPAWDPFLVLAALREATFEPLASAELKFLYWKTAFLVTFSVRQERLGGSWPQWPLQGYSMGTGCFSFSKVFA